MFFWCSQTLFVTRQHIPYHRMPHGWFQGDDFMKHGKRKYYIKVSSLFFVMMFLLAGCKLSDTPQSRVRGEIINDLVCWQDFIEKYADEHGYEWCSNDSEGIDLENKEIKYEDMSHNIWTSSVFSLEEGWSMDITFSVNSMVEWFDIELKCDKFERYNYNKEYISQVVYLYNELSNYEYSEEKIMQFIEGYAFEPKVDERRDNGWTTEDFYLLRQDLDKNEFSFMVGGWLKIPEPSVSGDDTKSSQENLPTPRTRDEEKEIKVNVIRSDSLFHEFYIKEDKVFIRCEITLENSSNEDEYVNLLANMQEDVDGGLLKAPIVTGYDEAGKSEFFVPAHSKKEYTVLFIGDFAGKEQKRNRDLPSIECVRVKD